MKLAISSDWKKRAALAVAVVLALCGLSGALQTTSVPAAPAHVPQFAKATVRWIIVSLPDRKLALFKDGKVVKVYRVAVGKLTTPSPTGEFKIVSRVANPTYYHKGQVIPPGANNPVGTRWMGLSAKSYGIHGTNQPNSIGKAASTGCIRMAKADLEELFTQVEVGDAVQIRAERDPETVTVFGEASAEAETLAQLQAAVTGNAGGQ